MALAPHQFRQLLDTVDGIHSCPSLQAFPDYVLRHVGALVAHNLAGYNEVNVPLQRAIITFVPNNAGHQWAVEPFQRNMSQHPVLRFYHETREGQAMAISDFLEEADYRALPIYKELFQRIAAEDQIAIGMRLDEGILVGLAFNRPYRGFTEDEREALNLIRPHVARAYLNLVERERARDQASFLEAALEESGLGVAEFDSKGHLVRHSSSTLVDSIHPFFQSHEALPTLVTSFALSGELAELHALTSGSEKLSLHLRKRGNHVLAIASKGVAKSKVARKYALTDRESEVAHWLCLGKTNPEIATILAIAPGTVKIHVQNIFAKLGVENRTQAAVALGGLL